ncbi:helix-turn-helix transcriptional regulator [Flavobacterium sp.]|uniref:helix-turn-helix domain-containing protein n=1 Tax=Flavobacterium sp. TaxID=239 RepID=UPI00263321FC|nr:helix-turn-helix transcriptional regulator [Flavobacterium sp.]
MKKAATLSKLLGLTQEEMAMLLGVSRGQWSMYEARKRDLPATAMMQLAEVLSHVQNKKEVSSESQKLAQAEQIKAQEKLQQEYRNLEFKNRILDKRIASIEKKRAEGYAALEVAHFLETQQQDTSDTLRKSIEIRAKNTLNKFSLHQLQDLQIKKEQLAVLKLSLEQRLKV